MKRCLYSVRITRDRKSGVYTASVNALEGCVAEGTTLREVRTNIRDALNGTLTSKLNHGDLLPADVPHGRGGGMGTIYKIRMQVEIPA